MPHLRVSVLIPTYNRAAFLSDAIEYCRFLPPVQWSIDRLVRAERSLRHIPGFARLSAIGFLSIFRKS